MSQCISIRFAFTFYFCHRWWRPRFPTERRWSCSGRRRKRRRRSSGHRTASRSTVAAFVPSFSQFKICFFLWKISTPTLMAFTRVTNAHGPSPQPTVCMSQTYSLTTATGSNQAKICCLCYFPTTLQKKTRWSQRVLNSDCCSRRQACRPLEHQ